MTNASRIILGFERFSSARGLDSMFQTLKTATSLGTYSITLSRRTLWPEAAQVRSHSSYIYIVHNGSLTFISQAPWKFLLLDKRLGSVGSLKQKQSKKNAFVDLSWPHLPQRHRRENSLAKHNFFYY